MQVLVIDDLKLIHRQIDHILTPADCRVVGELTALEALKRVRRDWFDLIIIDLILPQSNGLQLRMAMENVVQCTDGGEERRPYFVLCTGVSPQTAGANSQSQLCASAQASGLFDYYIQKPIRREELLKVARLAEMHGADSLGGGTDARPKMSEQAESLLTELDQLLGRFRELDDVAAISSARQMAESKLGGR